MSSEGPGWDGVSDFYEDDEGEAAVNAMWNLPIDAITGVPYEPFTAHPTA
ncbi:MULTISPECIES: hypothetical protein [Mycolicibacter]|uniref:Uncharacterized protein n=2 Tax=Mycolicibacter TaxID=1073531 RepID=A0ABU5XQ12_9MYCO|nr:MULTISPECIES: hypothetical protein [unclassified Mycolicibacter]MEB3023417.1 hypothetical protein [Mycolicibacter sp. MYC098]MEB3033759.1 hypothetical protein [Mycolicibacter sp. MYC340]